MSEAKIELLPCPFCGQRPVIKSSGTVDGDYVLCTNRRCQVNPCTLAGAIAVWNTRANEQRIETLETALSDLLAAIYTSDSELWRRTHDAARAALRRTP